MSDLISTLHAQHEELGRITERIDAAATLADSRDLQRELAALRTALLAHLEIEDTRLYPTLTASASDDGDQRLTETFSRNMQNVTLALTAFLERYGQGAVELAEFRRDWPLALRLLQDRIESEERQLYPLYKSRVRDGR